MFVVTVMTAFQRDQVDAGGGDHGGALKARRFDQSVQPPLEPQSINDQNVGFAHSSRISRHRLKDMSVAVPANQRLELDILAADPAHHVAQDRKRRDNLQLVAGRSPYRIGGGNSNHNGKKLQQGSAIDHGVFLIDGRYAVASGR